MPVILQYWDTLVNSTLKPDNQQLQSPSDEQLHVLIYKSEAEWEKTRSLLIEGVISKPKIKDKHQYLQLHHAMLIRLLDKLYAYRQYQDVSDPVQGLYKKISQHLENALRFIEDYFSSYLDRNEKVPTIYLVLSIGEQARQLEILLRTLKENDIDTSLIEILSNIFTSFFHKRETGTSYNELIYQKELMNELLSDGIIVSEITIREILFYLNFNNDEYVAHLYKKLSALVEPLHTRKEKIAALRFEQKSINQLRTKINCHFSDSMPSLKEQLNQWIEEEIKFLETEQTPEASQKMDVDAEGKIHTSLSVAKLALLLRLMVIDKIITNRVVAPVLRIVVKMVTTLQTENIAFGSLETKYHNPDRGTISAVKDMLFRWINILNKL
jgi:hypothetical protein